jgi:hypothetical protein
MAPRPSLPRSKKRPPVDVGHKGKIWVMGYVQRLHLIVADDQGLKIRILRQIQDGQVVPGNIRLDQSFVFREVDVRQSIFSDFNIGKGRAAGKIDVDQPVSIKFNFC